MTEKENIKDVSTEQLEDQNSVQDQESEQVTEEQVTVEGNNNTPAEDAVPEQDDVQTVQEEIPSMSEAMQSVEEIHIGDIVQGEILVIEDNKRAIVGLGGGLEGVIPQNELSAAPFENVTDVVNVGDKVDLVVIKEVKDKEQGSYLLSKKRIDARKVWDELQEKFSNNETIEAPVTTVVKGGLVVDAGVRGFVPASLVDIDYIEDFTPYEGNTYEFKIIEIEPSENRLILSRKALLEKDRASKKQEILDQLEAGQTIKGTVARLTGFGAFIDLGGVDGLVHISEIAHEHVEKPSDKLTVGEEVDVRVLSVDKEAERISLSVKDTLPGPWENIEDKVQKDDVLDGTVKRLTSFGAFVEVFPGVEGLVHISQISHKHIATPHEVLEVGEKIKVKVLDVKPEEQRLSLSMKALEEKEQGHSETQSRGPRPTSSPKQSSQGQEDPESGFTFGDILGNQLSNLTFDDDDDSDDEDSENNEEENDD